ncbi:MAG: CBS domain-containing protein [Bacteroidia bacterium]
MLTVKSILQKKGNAVFSVKPDQTVYDALKILAEKQIGAVLVMEGEELCGIFSERDYARKVILKGLFSKDALVQDVMTKDVISVTSNANVLDCMTLMSEKHIRHLPVIENNKILGMITIGDTVNTVIHSQRETIESLENYIKGGAYA